MDLNKNNNTLTEMAEFAHMPGHCVCLLLVTVSVSY